MRKIVLADNDIIHKLACCALLQELLQWLGAPPAEVWVLPSMRFMLRKKLKDNAAALADLNLFLDQVSIIPEADTATLELLPTEMDIGERQMLAILLNMPEVERMVTGDKRALRLMGSLCAKDSALELRLMQARVDCLESIMLALIEAFGFEAINRKATVGLKSDMVLQASFGTRKLEANAKEALAVYLNDVRKDAPFLPAA
jgi:hypothetical protein